MKSAVGRGSRRQGHGAPAASGGGGGGSLLGRRRRAGETAEAALAELIAGGRLAKAAAVRRTGGGGTARTLGRRREGTGPAGPRWTWRAAAAGGGEVPCGEARLAAGGGVEDRTCPAATETHPVARGRGRLGLDREFGRGGHIYR